MKWEYSVLKFMKTHKKVIFDIKKIKIYFCRTLFRIKNKVLQMNRQKFLNRKVKFCYPTIPIAIFRVRILRGLTTSNKGTKPLKKEPLKPA